MRGQAAMWPFLEVHVAGDYENATWAAFIDFLYLRGDAQVGCCDVEELLRCAMDNKFHKLQVRFDMRLHLLPDKSSTCFHYSQQPRARTCTNECCNAVP